MKTLLQNLWLENDLRCIPASPNSTAHNSSSSSFPAKTVFTRDPHFHSDCKRKEHDLLRFPSVKCDSCPTRCHNVLPSHKEIPGLTCKSSVPLHSGECILGTTFSELTRSSPEGINKISEFHVSQFVE